MITGALPGFVDAANQDLRLQPPSTAINAGVPLHPDVVQFHSLLRQYVRHQTSEARPSDGTLDLGAFEYAAAAPMQILTNSLPNPVRIRPYAQTLQASGGSGGYVWSVTGGTLPAGLYLDQQTGAIHGRPRLTGVFTFTVRAQDAQDQSLSATKQFTINSRLHF